MATKKSPSGAGAMHAPRATERTETTNVDLAGDMVKIRAWFGDLKLGEGVVDQIVKWVADAEKRLGNYYIDSLEIDLGVTLGVTAVGKLTIKNKWGQSSSYPHP